MIQTVTPLPARVLLPVIDMTDTFAVRHVYCVGWKSDARMIGMGDDPDRDQPFLFRKNPDNLPPAGSAFPCPPSGAGRVAREDMLAGGIDSVAMLSIIVL